MGIAQKMLREFADGVRARGQSYYAKGRVAITSAKAGEIVAARVRGTETYKVKLRLRGGRLHASCTCLYFGPEGEPCKHLWATILAADAKGLLPAAPVRPLRLIADVRHHLQPPAAARQQEAPGPGEGQGPAPRTDFVPGQYAPPFDPGTSLPEGILPATPRPALPSYPSSGRGPNPPRGRNNNNNNNNNAKPRPPHPNISNLNSNANSNNLNAHPPHPNGRPRTGPNTNRGPGPGPNVNGRPPSGPKSPQQRPPHLKGPKSQVPGGPRTPFNKAVRNEPKKAEVKKASLFYVVDAPATITQNAVVVTLARRQRRPGSERAVLRPWWPAATPGGWRPEPEDRVLMALLDEAQPDPSPPPASSATVPAPTPPAPRRYVLRPEMQAQMIERLARTGRCRLKRADDEEDPPALRWDDGRPWRFVIDARCADPTAKRWNWRGCLRRDDDRMDLAEPLVLLPGLVIQGLGRAARFDDAGIFAWMLRLRHEKEMVLAESQQDSMLGRILGESRFPPSELVEGLRLEEVDLPPKPCLTIRTPRQNWGSDSLIAELEFDYDGARVSAFPPGRMAVQTEQRRAIRRDVRAETKAKERLDELGFRETKDFRVEPGTMEVAAKKVPAATRDLVLDGWRVEAEGILYRTAGDFKLAVATGIDWFELSGQVDFGGQSLSLPDVLAAARRGETMIALDDGSMGMLPEDWLKKYGLLADLGSANADGLRFGKAQAGLLDALLAAQPGSKCDVAFTKVRKELHAFEGVAPLEAPPNFQGELRPYQREGLGWLDYLRKFDFGGILADDMGLGKTIQVLALLQRRKTKRQAKGPSLIVVPRSLVFNWMQESSKFTPKLKILDYTGPGRHASRESFPKYDVIVTTYGTLRSDIVDLSEMSFDYAILDEAQAIKNAESQAAKAARLLKANHRLAMSGTPIENHLGELWSIFEFLNPGMLGTATVFKKNAGGASGQDEGARQLLAKALRPFILRRTKKEVVKDLPDKVELTLSCDLEPAQRKIYEDLRAHYRSALLRTDAKTVAGSKIEVLEALLRLRQAACHPGLLDPARIDDPSAKLDMLLPQLAEVVEEGHKVLVFSQFTSFLAIVKKKLDAEGLKYEYLDGQTRDRQARVENFQTNPDIPIFLISLKAGGLGLNLTAAEYVYLLDPWWNPAVEAQAIDRSHRIGQTRNVFAYRLIARDTVEQKILDLQQKKRDLADAILNADNRVIQGLTRDDLEFLLS